MDVQVRWFIQFRCVQVYFIPKLGRPLLGGLKFSHTKHIYPIHLTEALSVVESTNSISVDDDDIFQGECDFDVPEIPMVLLRLTSSVLSR